MFFKNSIPCCTRMPSASASESFPLRALGHGHRGLRACDACARIKPFAPPKSKSWIRAWELHVVTSWQFRSYRVYVAITGSRCGCYEVYVAHTGMLPCTPDYSNVYLSKNRLNNSLHLWSEEISLVEEWISLDSNSSRVKIPYSASEISSGSLDIHSQRSDHWCHYPKEWK